MLPTTTPHYHVCLEGAFTRRCHPEYLSKEAHARLSRPGAFDGLRIHTDEIDEVIARISPGTLTVAVVMDSMDWFDPSSTAAAKQIHQAEPGAEDRWPRAPAQLRPPTLVHQRV